MNYPGLDFSQTELVAVMRSHYDEIIEFVTKPEFQVLVAELFSLRPEERPRFVLDVVLNRDALATRGIAVPKDLLLQRSAFGDRRPTLFVVKKYLPEKYSSVWQNVNLTFDSDCADVTVTRDPEKCWRPPLPVHEQAVAMANGIDLETI